MLNYRNKDMAIRCIAICAAVTPVFLAPSAAFAQAVKMKQTFKNKSNQNANDFHMETTLFILKTPLPKSDKFNKVQVIAGTKEADFSDGTVNAGASHTVEWSASGKNSKLVDHYFTFNGNEIKNSSELAALTQDFDATPSGGVYLTSVANSNDSGTLLTGSYSIYLKPETDFFTSLWDDTGDAIPLTTTPYTFSNGSGDGPFTFAMNPDQYMLVLGTADDGDTVSNFSTAFSPSATAPEPGSLALLGMAALPIAGLLRRRKA